MFEAVRKVFRDYLEFQHLDEIDLTATLRNSLCCNQTINDISLVEQ